MYGNLPPAVRYLIVGAGIHGLSTAWQLAAQLRASGLGDGSDVVVLDKTGVGAGASGIACGVIRNNYFQPAMRRLMAHSVSVWESDPSNFAYHPVGYMQISHEAMHADVASIYEQQQAIGYPSTFVEGASQCQAYMAGMFDDWQAEGITSILHEHRGGYAHNLAALQGLAAKVEAAGVRILDGVRVTGLDLAGGAVEAVQTDQGGSAASSSWSRPARGPVTCGRCSTCRSGSASATAPVDCTRIDRCGATGSCRRAPSRSTRARSLTGPATRRRSCTSTPTLPCTTRRASS
ncbi:MAG: NAD(P)/FAD-dependent oxidoreductase [Geodermatophilaceae bacterium]